MRIRKKRRKRKPKKTMKRSLKGEEKRTISSFQEGGGEKTWKEREPLILKKFVRKLGGWSGGKKSRKKVTGRQ